MKQAKYDFKSIEPKWQKYWEEHDTFKAVDFSDKPKFYALVEFPYPSGAGMHVGHIKAYSGLEVVSRKRRLEGYNVLFPIGFDAYGLPTENTAIKTGVHPRKVTDNNIKKFTNQLKRVGFSFDWSRVIDTTDEDYYHWTQWIFLKMYEHGLVFRDKTLVNYCPSCKVVLSNEDSQGGHCDICHSEIVQKTKEVWYLRITEYADKLLAGLDEVNYLPNIKLQQQNWIGKSTGAFVDFKVKENGETLRVYTTRPDTLYGVTFMVIAPEHPMIEKYRDSIRNIDALDAYKAECAKKSEFERTQLVKDKTGVKIEGLTGINPITEKEVPIYISDYVMMGYGTGAIMAVPAHDSRDYDFAKKFGIDIIPVIKGGDIESAVQRCRVVFRGRSANGNVAAFCRERVADARGIHEVARHDDTGRGIFQRIHCLLDICKVCIAVIIREGERACLEIDGIRRGLGQTVVPGCRFCGIPIGKYLACCRSKCSRTIQSKLAAARDRIGEFFCRQLAARQSQSTGVVHIGRRQSEIIAA